MIEIIIKKEAIRTSKVVDCKVKVTLLSSYGTVIDSMTFPILETEPSFNFIINSVSLDDTVLINQFCIKHEITHIQNHLSYMIRIMCSNTSIRSTSILV